MFDLLRRQCACGLHSECALVLRRRQSRLSLGFLDGGCQPIHLRQKDGAVKLGHDLALLHVIPDLDVNFPDAPGIRVRADRHVVARRQSPGEGNP